MFGYLFEPSVDDLIFWNEGEDEEIGGKEVEPVGEFEDAQRRGQTGIRIVSKGAIDEVEQVGNEDETGVDKKFNLVGSSLFDLTEIKMLLKGLKEDLDAPAKSVKAQNLLRAKVFLIEVGNKDFETEKEAGAASISKSIVAVFSMLAAAFIGHLLREFDGDQTNRKLGFFAHPNGHIEKLLAT